MRRARGFTLVEIMVAMALAGLASVFLLMITRAQLTAYQMNENVGDAQLNTRAGMDYLENQLRRACGGIANGLVAVNVNGVTPTVVPCVQVHDGVDSTLFSSGGFQPGSTATAQTKSDAVDVIYGTAPAIQVIPSSIASTSPTSAGVCDATGFAALDLVLLTDMKSAYLVRLASATLGPPTTTCPNQGTLTFDLAIASPAWSTPVPVGASPLAANGATWVMKATSFTLYRNVGVNPPELMLVPDGVASTASNHNADQPLVQGVENFEVAIGQDSSPATPDGIINDGNAGQLPDEWLGNVTGELPLPVGYSNTVDTNGNPTSPLYKQIRATLVVRTSNIYPGDAVVPQNPGGGPVEDRTNSFVTSATSASGAPRYRWSRVTVAPRAWNLLN